MPLGLCGTVRLTVQEPNVLAVAEVTSSASKVTGVTANANGSFSRSFIIPALPANSYNVVASGALTSAGSVKTQVLNLTTNLTLSSTSGVPGSTIVISGQGFGANEQDISISYDNTALASGITADNLGAFTTSFTVPPSPAGRHSIVISGSTPGVAGGSNISFLATPGFTLSRKKRISRNDDEGQRIWIWSQRAEYRDNF